MNYGLSTNILLVEDDPALGAALREYLDFKGFQVRWARSAAEAWRQFDERPPALCLLDIGLPDADGFELARQLLRKSPQLPFLFLTARTLKADMLRGFALGADDYLTKPVDEEELVARLSAVLRRSARTPPAEREYYLGAYVFQVDNQRLRYEEQVRQLTEREARLLALLCEYRGRLLPRSMVLRELWGQSDYFVRRSMDVFISRLRRYLADDPSIRIENVYGSGFILSIDGEEDM